MFTFLAVLLLYSLLSFGGVLPHSWLTVAVLWVAGVGGLLVVRRPVQPAFLVLLAFGALLALLVEIKVAVGVFAAGWAWMAARGAEKPVLKFFHFLVLVGILEALLGLTQYFLDPGWIFGYQNPHGRSSGTLINRNHFAGLLEMLIPVTFGFAYIGARRYGEMARPYVYLLGGAFMGLALLFSVSRMGIFSFLVTLLFLVIVVQLREARRKIATALGLGLFGLVVAGALWIGIDVIVERYAQLLEEDAVLQEGRMIVFRDTARMIATNPWGVGTGNYQDLFRQYQTFYPGALFDHAHNDYLETTAEWGIPIAVAFWGFLFFVLFRSVWAFLVVRSPERRGILLACMGAIFSILVHSLTDFNLQIPSNAMLFFSFVGIAIHHGGAETRRSEDPSA